MTEIAGPSAEPNSPELAMLLASPLAEPEMGGTQTEPDLGGSQFGGPGGPGGDPVETRGQSDDCGEKMNRTKVLGVGQPTTVLTAM